MLSTGKAIIAATVLSLAGGCASNRPRPESDNSHAQRILMEDNVIGQGSRISVSQGGGSSSVSIENGRITFNGLALPEEFPKDSLQVINGILLANTGDYAYESHRHELVIGKLDPNGFANIEGRQIRLR